MKAAILAVGTELTSGQITNRNAAWIAQRLSDCGISAPWHLTVPDDRELILLALNECERQADQIFITGGLGPTTDDFTRDLVAEWAGLDLKWDEPAWSAIVSRLNRLGAPIAESNRRQCYFPIGSLPLPNPAGTAQGFFLSVRGKKIWVLPGPPKEIETIWEGSIAPALATESSPILYKWQCLGLSESALGEIVERAIEGAPLKSGYRAHRPYIEVKIWCAPDRIADAQPAIERLEKALAPWIQCRGDEDLAEIFVENLTQFCREKSLHFLIQDQVTQGAFSARVSALLSRSDFLRGNIQTTFQELEPVASNTKQLQLVIQPDLQNPRQFFAVAQWSGQELISKIEIPYPPGVGELRVRANAYSAEKALAEFISFLIPQH